MEFADETPHLIPAVRIHVIGMGSRNDVRRAVLKRQATHSKRHVHDLSIVEFGRIWEWISIIIVVNVFA